ncbi:MAG: AmmeMemoRadiSam system protein A [Gammaproteobacteria bacterium]|nr:AmmeMemoRadiSam system protein A [Gammaproteobacteria bacterium]
MSSTETTLDTASRQRLVQIARDSIVHGLKHGRALPIDARDYPDTLRVPRATFVTLHKDGELRGCIGTLEAHRPLVEDVADNAFNAAFHDPRFVPLRAEEFPHLDMRISVLSPPMPMTFRDEADLLAQLRPGIDGLILAAPDHYGTFLPSVWESLPRAEDFLRHLKRKADLPADYWSSELQMQRYTTEAF